MSFILDALRKSESERQRDAAPSLSRIPEAAKARGLPGWAAGTIALLGLGVIGLGVALWLNARGNVAGPAVQAAGNGIERQVPAPAASAPPAAAAALPAPGRSPSPAAQQPLRGERDGRSLSPEDGSSGPARPGPLDSPAGRSLQPGSRAATEPALAAQPPDSKVRTESELAAARNRSEPAPAASSLGGDPTPGLLPSYASAAASDGSLPKLNLEFHAFADDPARRFVYINGEKYQEGSRLEQGLRVVRITADGVVLEAAGRQLLLSRK